VLGAGKDGMTLQPEGLPGAEMDVQQKAQLLALIEARLGIIMNADDRAAKMAEVRKDLDQTYFAWFGPAEPLGAAYWRVTGPTVLLEFSPQALGGDLTPGMEVAGALLQALDADADRIITEAEAPGYAERVLARSTLTLDDVAMSWMLDAVNVPPYRSLELGGGTVSIHAVAQHPDGAGAHVLSYRNDHQPAASRRTANVFLQPGEGWRYRVTGQRRSDDGRQLTVTYTVAHR